MRMLKSGFLNMNSNSNRPYDTLYLLRSETHLNKVCTVLYVMACLSGCSPVMFWSLVLFWSFVLASLVLSPVGCRHVAG